MQAWIIISVIVAYTAGLFFLAWRGDKQANENGVKSNKVGYALALAVYCTSWTYYGAVGTAVSNSWDYIWIYVGPALVFLVFPHMIRRIGDVAQRENITSLSDFLASRYGKSQNVAVLATLAAVTGSLPYIALQLQSVGLSFLALTESEIAHTQSENDAVLFTAIAMAAFAILFGARQSDNTKHNTGLMHVLAFEAVVKLFALLLVAVMSVGLMKGGLEGVLSASAQHFSGYDIDGRAVTILLLSMAAIICLPRQFHVAIIERRTSGEALAARWLFPIYLALTSLVVIPITVAGISVLPTGSAPDLFVLNMPLASGNYVLANIVFLGGFSASTGMVIVSTIALSSMITNGLISPIFLRRAELSNKRDFSGRNLVFIRRLVIIGLLFLAYGYFRIAQDNTALANIGLLSFAAAAQFVPALLAAVYWRKGSERGAFFGLLCGMIIWLYTLFIPAIVGVDNLSAFVPSWLNPHGLFGFGFDDPLTHGVFWSLLVNSSVFVALSYRSRERLRDRVQAVVFTNDDATRISPQTISKSDTKAISPDGLKVLAARFLPDDAVVQAFEAFEAETGTKTSGSGASDWKLVQFTEKFLARAIGSSSARIIMASVVAGESVNFDDMLSLFEQRSQTQKFDEHLLQSMLENIPQGISVVDSKQKLVAWNSPYADLFNYPAELLRVGTPVKKLIDHNVRSGWIDAISAHEASAKRVFHMQKGRKHVYERQHPNGQFIRIEGGPVPGGGYLTTFTDITRDKLRERELINMNDTLEARVRERTAELEQLTAELEDAHVDAVGSNASKTRFLAAASHDLLQPLNAARLFLGAIQPRNGQSDLIAKVDQSIQSADNLLKGLLDISRLDHSAVESKPETIPLNLMFEDLIEEALPMALKSGLKLSFVPTSLSVSADPDFLLSILRNLLSNARRYTHSGGVLLGARRQGDAVRIEVWDTGVGIPKDKHAQIFQEFQRAEDLDNSGVRGAGLGLSVASRMADIMGAKINFRSMPGKGSVFSVSLPRVSAQAETLTPAPSSSPVAGKLSPMTVLCIDDEASVLDAMQTLLSGWDCNVLISTDGAGALKHANVHDINVVIADFQIGASENGLDIIRQLRPHLSHPTNVCLLTARRTEAMVQRAANDNVLVLNKPANPADIREFLLACSVHTPE